MKTIWKFPLPAMRAVIDMPVGAQIVHVAKQGPGNDYCVWAIVESDNATEKRLLAAIGTGHAIPLDGRYIGTWQDGPFWWHLFEPTQASGEAGK
jgi:hypothetical protein